MKNAQNEFEKSTEKSLSINTRTTNNIEQQTIPSSSVLATVPVSSSTTSIGISTIENTENVQSNNNNATAAAATTTTAHAAKMTEEHDNKNENGSSSSNSVSNNNNNNNNNSSSGNSIIAEAAKILLKNGINGTSAAAAALLAAQSFQLPAFPPLTSPSENLSRVKTDIGLLEPPPAHVASTSKMSTAISTTIAIGHSPQRNNGLPSPSSHFKGNIKDSYNAIGAQTSSGVNLVRKPLTTLDAGVIDCSFGTTPANGAQKSSMTTAGYSHGSSIGGGGGGGRLQFFKDGKFILELARSKDGERGGWVSVPRKQFRSPSATSSTVTPASTASACIYPKIESSTSFSFSDDNSSIQSSPWQRDHCWKQATPKRNISKEMSVYYQLPKGITLTNEGLRLAKLKRRRPYDNTKFDIKLNKFFENINEINSNLISQQPKLQNGQTDKTTHSVINQEEDEDRCSNSSVATLTGDNDENSTNDEKMNEQVEKEIKRSATISKTTKIVDEKQENVDIEIATELNEETTTTKTDKLININDNDNKMDETACNSDTERMNTSEDGEIDNNLTNLSQQPQQLTESSKIDIKKPSSPGVIVDVVENSLQRPQKPTPVKSKTGVEDKRLIKKKIVRAKLTTIVQKLIDQMPTRVSNLLKTPIINSSAGLHHNSNSLSNKVSPTSSSSTSPSLISSSAATAGSSTTVGTASSHRLVEYHQQHVSPRKRILREFEKVSLDDSSTVSGGGGAGGKRSRAKSCANTAMSTNYRNARSPNNRIHSSVCNVPTASSLSTTITSSSSTNGESQFGTKHSKNANTATASIATTNVAPTRLYSSYSIHSLLADNASTSSNSNSGNTKKSLDHNIAAYHQSNSEHLHATSNIRKSVSPKSPEAGGGKSPSNIAHKKRSPPYASPLREAHSRSPTVRDNFDRSPRATPPDFKQRYGAPGLTEHSMLTNPNAHLHHHRQQQQQGAFYSPYMMSSKYVPGSSGSSLATTSGAVSPPNNNSRSPRHTTNTFTSCTTTPTNASTATTTPHNIPNSQLTMSHHRDISPTRSLAGSPRDTTTPRTVPKKTASIRRQFASPTSSSCSSSSHSHNTTNSSSSCPSPGGINSEENSIHIDSKTSSSSSSSNAAIAYQQMLQRQSSSNAAAAAAAAAASSSLASPLHAAAYYMYPPAAPPFSSNGGSSSIANTGGAPSSSQHTASTSPYIPTLMPPSYYHSYISALNITKHYYMGAGASPQSAAAAAAARLSPPFHHLGIPYNGVSAAAMAAMAAAAFSTGQPNHLGHHSMLPPPTAAAATAAALYGVSGGLSALGNLNPSATLSSSSASSLHNKSIESNLSAFSDVSSMLNNNISQSGPSTSSMRSNAAAAVTATTTAAQHSHNIKDEQSSDVPLNLSKH